ncbi:hypothetical protein FD755_022988 [Muntiacus reevesi]|uniref:Uncharacterized protein n=1 Tax=Muntiacus reevesi TaxID=9886 RepID=A0A5N3VZ31_MUNRE|nr:hypothetical protein FD755_022988 [Muntiacus reevesi]
MLANIYCAFTMCQGFATIVGTVAFTVCGVRGCSMPLLPTRHSSYGRLLDDHDYGSWGNYNNPLYDDS